jgi:hypothetical protein
MNTASNPCGFVGSKNEGRCAGIETIDGWCRVAIVLNPQVTRVFFLTCCGCCCWCRCGGCCRWSCERYENLMENFLNENVLSILLVVVVVVVVVGAKINQT